MAETQLEHWLMWYEKCALGRCSGPVAFALQSFACNRMRTFLRRYATRTNLGRTAFPLLSDAEAWHLFESHMVATSTRSGKRYKDWLFARTQESSDPPVAVVESGVSLIIRTVTRNWLSREFSPRGVISMQTVVSGTSGSGLTLEDLLPAPAAAPPETACAEYEQLAHRHATARFASAGYRERVVLLARALDIPLSHDVVAKAAGCGKTVLSQCYRSLVEGIGEEVQRAYPDEGDGAMQIAMLILQNLKERIFLWGKAETVCAELFIVARAR